MKYLTVNQVIELITTNDLTLRQSIGLITTPKKYAIIFKEYLYTTDDVKRTMIRIAIDHPTIKPNEVSIVNCKEYQQYLTDINN